MTGPSLRMWENQRYNPNLRNWDFKVSGDKLHVLTRVKVVNTAAKQPDDQGKDGDASVDGAASREAPKDINSLGGSIYTLDFTKNYQVFASRPTTRCQFSNYTPAASAAKPGNALLVGVGSKYIMIKLENIGNVGDAVLTDAFAIFSVPEHTQNMKTRAKIVTNFDLRRPYKDIFW